MEPNIIITQDALEGMLNEIDLMDVSVKSIICESEPENMKKLTLDILYQRKCLMQHAALQIATINNLNYKINEVINIIKNQQCLNGSCNDNNCSDNCNKNCNDCLEKILEVLTKPTI